MDIKQVIGDYELFIKHLQANLLGVGIDITGYQVDHLCYRIATLSEYHDTRAKLTSLSSELATTIHNGREFSIFKLKQPLVTEGLRIPLIELPTPASDKPYATGLEHAEVVIPGDFKEFCDRHEGVFTRQPDTNSDNPTAIITFADKTTVKFHPLSLAETVILQDDRFEVIVH